MGGVFSSQDNLKREKIPRERGRGRNLCALVGTGAVQAGRGDFSALPRPGGPSHALPATLSPLLATETGTVAQGPQDSSSAQSTSCSQRRGSVLLPRSPSRKPPPGPGLGPLAVDTRAGAAAALHLLSLAGQPSALPATPRNPDQQIQQGLLKEQERAAQEASPSPSTALQEPGSGLSPETLSSEMLHLCRHLPGMALEHPKWSASKPCPTPASPSPAPLCTACGLWPFPLCTSTSTPIPRSQ